MSNQPIKTMKSPFNIWDKRSLKIHLMNLQGLLVYLDSIPCETPCRACKNHQDGHCHLCDMVIPDDVKPKGCESFEFDETVAPF